MNKQKKDFSKIVHISTATHNKLKKFVTDKQIKGKPSSLSSEAEKAINNHVSGKAG